MPPARRLYLTHPACLEHDPGRVLGMHPESPERLRAIEARLAERRWLGWERREAPAATEADLELAHSRRHVEAIRDLCAAGGGAIDADTAVGEASWEAALRAAGAACEMTRELVAGRAEVGFCAVRPPGHHAEWERAMGFCLFNNVAIALETAVRRLGVERAMAVDLDVHHGNGTAALFHRRRDVLVAGIHQAGIFPGSGPLGDVGAGEGEGYTLNLPVPAGSGEAEWLALLDRVVEPAGRRFAPQLILVSAGFDAHRADPLAGCRLESATYGRLAARLRRLGDEVGAPVGAVLEGGYAVGPLAESVQATMIGLAGEGEVGTPPQDAPGAAEAVRELGRHWGP